MTLIARKADFEWLEREKRWSSLILCTGVRGIGKTTLIKEWMQKQTDKRCLWLNTSRYRDLSTLLESPGASAETALEKYLPNLKNVDLVVWDDIHLLNPAARKALLAFLHHTPLLPLQILLSDEEIDAEDLGSIGHRRLSPFSKAEVEEFLRNFSSGTENFTADFALEKTGGIPLLLKHLLQHGENAAKEFEKILEPLSADVRNLFDSMVLLGRPISTTEAALLCAAGETALFELQRKCLLEKTGDGALYFVPHPVRSLCWNQFAKERKQNLSLLLCERFQKNFLGLEYAFHALRSGNKEHEEKALSHELLDSLEHLSTEDLREFSRIIDDEKAETIVPLKERLRLRSLLVLGHREEAIRASAKSLTLLQQSRRWSNEEEFLALEIVQLHNRCGRTEEARRLAQRGMERARESLKPLLQIEEAVSFLNADPARAKTLLLPAVAKLQREHAAPLALAQANFQLARAYDTLEQTQEAELHYSLSLDGFQRSDKPYFGTVALLNLGWLALRSRNFSALAGVKEKLSPLCARFGYAYARAGLAILEASEARLFLRTGDALAKIESAIASLGPNAPLPARVDALTEQVRILLNLGLRLQAEKTLAQLRTLCENHPAFADRVKALALEARAEKESSEHWLEASDRSDLASPECFAIFRAHRGIQFKNEEEQNLLKAHVLGILARTERALTDALLGGEKETAWSLIARMEKILTGCSEARSEKVALLLTQAALTDSDGEKNRFLERGAMELQRWGADETVKAPLRAWMESIQENQASPRSHPAWQKSSVGDQERWKRWFMAFERAKKQGGWLLFTNEGRAESMELPARSKISLYVVDHLADVRWNNTPIDDFVRRHSLRKLLCLLLENSQGVDKQTIASLVWGESYDPLVHDARIYTSVQRLRSLFQDHDCVQNWDRGYRWNPSLSYALVRPLREGSGNAADTRCQNLILQALEQSTRSGRQWVARGELVEITKSSEATVKRELAKLLSSSLIHRQGKGRAVVYGVRRGIA